MKTSPDVFSWRAVYRLAPPLAVAGTGVLIAAILGLPHSLQARADGGSAHLQFNNPAIVVSSVPSSGGNQFAVSGLKPETSANAGSTAWAYIQVNNVGGDLPANPDTGNGAWPNEFNLTLPSGVTTQIIEDDNVEWQGSFCAPNITPCQAEFGPVAPGSPESFPVGIGSPSCSINGPGIFGGPTQTVTCDVDAMPGAEYGGYFLLQLKLTFPTNLFSVTLSASFDQDQGLPIAFDPSTNTASTTVQ